jgi:5'-nucleotidase / UDP-sugar diphosphatase
MREIALRNDRSSARGARLLAAFALSGVVSLLAGCDPTGAPIVAPATAPAAAPRGRAPAAVKILYTTDEHGWLLPSVDKGEVRGGAAEMLAVWVAAEGHCPGAPPGGALAPPRVPACNDPSTIALSGGDNWTGPAISSFFTGGPMADAMRRMGYAAAAFGNHEFDFGRDVFLENRERAGYPYLAANLHVKDRRHAAFELPAFTVIERKGLRIGVVGIATERTLESAMASRFDGIAFLPEEPALTRAVAEAWRAEPDALVLLAHECPDRIEPILARHPEWDLSFVGAGHCHKKTEARVGGVPLINPGWRMRTYARVRLDIDPRRPLHKRVLSVGTELVEVAHPQGAPPAPPDEVIAAESAGWQRKLDTALGEQIGYSNGGLERDSPEMRRWIAGAWREQLGVDVAILNKDGIRQSVPRGPITKATVYSVLPFDNKLLICVMKGGAIVETLRNHEAVFTGVSPVQGGRYQLQDGSLLDEGRLYRVATIDFLYFGGDGFLFQNYDPSPSWTGLDWRAPVIAWTKALATSPTAPLEARVR